VAVQVGALIDGLVLDLKIKTRQIKINKITN
jgi:hypothetical protein